MDQRIKDDLFKACSDGHIDDVKKLLKEARKLDVNYVKGHRHTPLSIACVNGHVEIARMLIARGAEFNKFASFSVYRPLDRACFEGHIEIIRMLCEKRANVGPTPDCLGRMSPLSILCGRKNDYAEGAKILLEHGADVNGLSFDGLTPLQDVCRRGHTETARLLLLHGADIEKACNSRSTPLYYACRYGRTETVKFLLEHGAIVNSLDQSGATPLWPACSNGHVSIVKILLEHGLDVKKKTASLQAGNPGVVEEARVGVDVNIATLRGELPFTTACEKQQKGAVHLLLEYGNDHGEAPAYV